MESPLTKLMQMAQTLVDVGLITKDQRLELAIQDYERIQDLYYKVNLGTFSISKWANRKCEGIYSNIN